MCEDAKMNRDVDVLQMFFYEEPFAGALGKRSWETL